jgi:hypothetical protein
MHNIVRFTIMIMLLSLTLGAAAAQDDSTEALDQSVRWLMMGIEELDALEAISDDERESVRDYLLEPVLNK